MWDVSGQKAKIGDSGIPMPPAGYDPSPSPLCLQATRENEQFQLKFAQAKGKDRITQSQK
jgi:hypothetical protein